MNERELGMQRAVGSMFSVECQDKQFRFYFKNKRKVLEDFK